VAVAAVAAVAKAACKRVRPRRECRRLHETPPAQNLLITSEDGMGRSSNAKHQAAWRKRRRTQGSRPVTVWLDQALFARVAQVSQGAHATRELVITRALTHAMLSQQRVPDAYWWNLRQTLEAQERAAGKGGTASASRASDETGTSETPSSAAS
jgi:hypothetical protein